MDALATRRLRRRILFSTLILCLVIIGTGALIWFAMPPNIITQSVTLHRQPDGRFSPVNADESGMHLYGKFFYRKTQSNLNSESMTNVSDNAVRAPFPCRRVAVMVADTDLLTRRTAEVVFTQLQKEPYIEEISYYPDPPAFSPGMKSPDLFVTIARRTPEPATLFEEQADYTVVASVTPTFLPEPAHIDNPLALPASGILWQGRFNLTVKGIQLYSSGARLAGEGEQFGKAIADSLSDAITESIERYGVYPKLPATIYPAYAPPPALPVLKCCNASAGLPAAAFTGPFIKTDAYWQVPYNEKTGETLFNQLYRQLRNEGWTGEPPEKYPLHLLMRKKTETLLFSIWSDRVSIMETNGSSDLMTIQYRRFVDDYERRAAVRPLIAGGMPAADLLLFTREWQPGDAGRISAQLQQHPPRTLAGCLQVAEYARAHRRVPLARQALQAASILLETEFDITDDQKKIDELAKALRITLPAQKTLLSRLGSEMQFVQLPAAAPYPDIEIGLFEPARYYRMTEDDDACFISMTVKPAVSDEDGSAYACEIIENGQSGGRSKMSRIIGTADSIHDLDIWIDDGRSSQQTIYFHIEQVKSNPPRFRIQPKEY
ncbi:MAG: hypothetical protein ACYC6A_00940 [Armatimonadota bacterium]